MPRTVSLSRFLLLLLASAPAWPPLAAPAAAQLTAAAPRQATMPRLIGLTQAQAARRLEALGMAVQLSEVASREPRGTVATQQPEAGTPVKQGAVAILGISTGPAAQDTTPSRTQQGGTVDGGVSGSRGGVSGGIDVRVAVGVVPNLTGLSLSIARLRLAASGLRSGAVDSADAPGARPGRVVAQDPAPGTQLLPGGRVQITLQRRAPAVVPPAPPAAPERVAVPNLVGRPADEARAMLGGARLLLGGVDSAASSRGPGTVLQQTPAAGDSVAPGSFVTVVVARAPRVAVPRVTDLPLDGARQALEAVGLRAGAVREREAPGAARILEQSVAAGTEVPPGTVVALVVSRAPAVVPQPPVATPTDSAQTVQNPPARPDSARAPADSAPAPGTNPPVAPRPPAATQTQASTPAPRPAAEPAPAAKRGWVPEPKWFLWVALALMVLGIAELIRSRVRKPAKVAPAPADAPAPVAAPVPLALPLRLRVKTGAGDATPASDAPPTDPAKLRLAVKVAEPRTEADAATPALAGPRVVVRARVVEESALAAEAAGGAALADAPVRVRVRGGTETIAIDEDEPVILARR